MECTLARIMNVGISLEEAQRVSREISQETMASYDAVVPQQQRPRSGPDTVSYVLGPHTLHPGLTLSVTGPSVPVGRAWAAEPRDAHAPWHFHCSLGLGRKLEA